jgi:multicomponent Na+:H+ antiporter subunit E
LLACLWWVISGGSPASWLVGLPVLVLAVWASHRLGSTSEHRLSVLGLLRFVPFFILESLRGGIDVAIRTLMPRMPIEPGFLRFHATLRSPPARIFFTNCVSLLPGTLAADLQEDWLEIHVLNRSSDHQAELTRLQHHVARIFVNAGEKAHDRIV